MEELFTRSKKTQQAWDASYSPNVTLQVYQLENEKHFRIEITTFNGKIETILTVLRDGGYDPPPTPEIIQAMECIIDGNDECEKCRGFSVPNCQRLNLD